MIAKPKKEMRVKILRKQTKCQWKWEHPYSVISFEIFLTAYQARNEFRERKKKKTETECEIEMQSLA